MSFVFPTNASQVQAFAGALYGVQVGSTTMAQVNADIAANGGLAATLNSYYAASFGGVANATVANIVATNLGLTGSALTSGTAYITAQLNAAAAGARGQVISSIVNLFSNLASDATFGAAATAWNAKVAIAAAYTGAANVAVGTQVTTNGVFTLTASSNSTTAGVDNFTGGAGDDVFNALVLNSLDNSDNLVGGAGTDTVNARFDNSATGANTVSVTPVMSGIEVVNITGFGAENAGDAVTFNGSNASGLERVIVKDDSSTTAGDVLYTVNNVTNAVSVGVQGGQVNAAGTGLGGDITVTYSAASVAGNADSATFILGAGNSSGFANIVNIAGIETLNIDAANGGGRIGTLTAANARTINITGSKNVTIADVQNSTATTKIDASAATGNVTIGSNASGGVIDATTSVVTGSGNDTVWFTSSRIASTDTINAGSGSDTLGLIGGLSSAITVAGFENLRVADGGSTYDVSKISGTDTAIAAIRIDTTGANATFTGVANNTSLQVTGDAPGTIAVTTTGTADTLSLSLDNGAGANADGVDVTTGTFTGVTRLNITSNDSLSQLTGTNANSIGGLGMATVSVAASARTEVTSTRAAAVTIDASTSTARVDITATSTVAGTLTGGANNDSITSGAGNDVISGGAGNDTIVGATGNDTLRGDAGNDTFTFSALSAITAADVIDGGEGTDSLNITEDAALDFTADTTLYTGITNVERIVVTNSTNARTITVNDSTVSQFGGNLTIATSGDKGHTIALGTIGSSASKVTVSAASQTTAGLTIQIGSGTETLTGFTAALNDSVTAALPGYLQSTDNIDAGAGTNTFTFQGAANASTSTVTAAQLGALRNFASIVVDDGTNADTSRFDITLSDTVLSQNNASNTLAITREASDAGVLRVIGSAVSATYTLSLTGADGNDTLTGGAGNDTIYGEAGTDSLTGGAGNDTFNLWNTAAIDTITDFDFGTSTTAVDVLQFDDSELGTVGLDTGGTVTVVRGAVSDAAATTDVLVITGTAYADAAALDTALETLNAGTVTQAMIVIYQDSLGIVRVALGDSDGSESGGAADFTTTDLGRLTGITITGVSSLINATDFSIVA